MSHHPYESDEETGRLLTEALHARTAHVVGRPDSLAELRRAYRGKSSRQTRRLPQTRRLFSFVSAVATASAVLLVVVGIYWLGHNYSPASAPTRPTHSSVPLKTTGSGYPPTDYYPAVRSDGQPVIVRVTDGQLMRVLPRARVYLRHWAPISPMILSPDGNRLYGVGRDLQANGKPYPAGYGVDHVVSIDLRTNQFTSFATRGERITGLTLSADGTTFAYALRGSQDGQPDRDVIYVHDLVHDTDRHFLLAAGPAHGHHGVVTGRVQAGNQRQQQLPHVAGHVNDVRPRRTPSASAGGRRLPKIHFRGCAVDIVGALRGPDMQPGR